MSNRKRKLDTSDSSKSSKIQSSSTSSSLLPLSSCDKEKLISSLVPQTEIDSPPGPFEEFGEDSSCSSSNEDDKSSDDDDIDELPKMLFVFAENILEENPLHSITDEYRNKARKAFLKCKTVILEINEDLNKLFIKSKKRSSDDTKVPPGSNDVTRTLADKRYILSYICTELGHIASIEDDYSSAISEYKESLMWYPKNSESCLHLANINKAQSLNQQDLIKVEKFLRKASLASDITIPIIQSNKVIKSSKTINTSAVELQDDDEEDNDDDMEKQLEYFENQLLKRQLKASKEAQEALALLLCQDNRSQEACTVLQKQGYKWRLSRDVLYYQYPSTTAPPSSTSDCTSTSTSEVDKYISVTENILPAAILAHMRHIFRNSSPFWKEHKYDYLTNASRSVGYFSYLYPFKERKSVTFIEQ
eukprot:gene3722-7397_t